MPHVLDFAIANFMRSWTCSWIIWIILDHPGSSWITTSQWQWWWSIADLLDNSQGALLLLPAEATGYTTCQKCHAQNVQEPCRPCRCAKLWKTFDRYKQTYNLKTGVVRSCELRYDMRFGSTWQHLAAPRAHRFNNDSGFSMKPPMKVTAREIQLFSWDFPWFSMIFHETIQLCTWIYGKPQSGWLNDSSWAACAKVLLQKRWPLHSVRVQNNWVRLSWIRSANTARICENEGTVADYIGINCRQLTWQIHDNPCLRSTRQHFCFLGLCPVSDQVALSLLAFLAWHWEAKEVNNTLLWTSQGANLEIWTYLDRVIAKNLRHILRGRLILSLTGQARHAKDIEQSSSLL